ncbi:MAG TPA: glycoside hydrolase family 38 C-terminal domain-containing protein, partial [Acidimicrobiales bacterium]|nr:glycoside hydrolase family 38 C-terminal domain-containing protein [Acidimicrobiales bacterium]
SLYAYGYGDGGGGPTQAMLDSYRRIRDLDPFPKVELGTARSFFEAVETEAVAAEAAMDEARPGTVTTAHTAGTGGLPVWVGELYLERHRAVQTTQAKAKLGNRRSEELLRRAEMWAVAGLGDDYPQAELERAWKIVLLHQFHDILPGSSIHWVHQDSQAEYAVVREIAEGVIDRACAAIASRVPRGETAASALVFNAGSHRAERLVEFDPDGLGAGLVAAVPAGGEPTAVQVLASGRLGLLASVPGCGWRRYDFVSSGDTKLPAVTPPAVRVLERDTSEGHEIELSNGILTVTLDSSGLLSSLVDEVTGRQVLPAGARGNVLQLHLDLPNDSDAWDVDQGTFNRATDLTDVDSIEVTETGPVRATVRVVRSFGKSRIAQDIALVAGARQVEFATEVDWQERHRFLKAAFPVTIRSSFASYEVQFGYIQRPTHANTTWDAARFEVAAHRWADLSEPGAGVALLNDCKYGYDVRGSVMRLSLLRGPTWPDPEADLGEHHFSYALYPHEGLAVSLGTESSVVRLAEAFNLGLQAVPMPTEPAAGGAQLEPAASLFEVKGAMVSAVKWADRGGGTVVRLWEAAGSHGQMSVRGGAGCGRAIASAERTDSLERPLEDLAVEAGTVEVAVKPFELVTLKLDC